MRVLITGAAGFIGSHLVEDQLERGREVVAVDLSAGALDAFANRRSFWFHQVDVVEASFLKSLMDGVDVVFHLAAAQREIEAGDDRFREVNVRAMRPLLENAQNVGVRRFVHLSSADVYGDVNVIPANEDTAPTPTNIYEQTRLDGERAALAFSAETSYPVVALRPSWVYGPRCPRTALFLRAVSKGRLPGIGDGNNFRHPLFVRDLIAAINAAAERPGVEGRVFLIAGERYLRANEFLETVAEVTGGRIPRWKIPAPPLARAAAIVEAVFRPFHVRPPLSARALNFFTRNQAFDTARARQQLGFLPATSLRDGLKETWDRLNETAPAGAATEEMAAPAVRT